MNEAVTHLFGLFCNPESRRVEGFYGSLGKLMRQTPVLVPWQFLLEDHPWPELLTPLPSFLRLESPGRNWRVEQLLLLHGAGLVDEEDANDWRRMSVEGVKELPNDPGRILPMRQWFLGWRQLLRELSSWVAANTISNRWLVPPEDVICMFDKAACQTVLSKAGSPVPPVLGIPGSFDDLWERMRAHGCRRVFLKPCHGSSASGVVALESSGSQLQAQSTVEIVEAGPEPRLYNRRRIIRTRGAADVRRLVDSICRERCLAQVWIPKAGLSGRTFDVRIVVIGGKARQVMVRLGLGPITNSQLLGGKLNAETLQQRMGEEAWNRMLKSCEQALAVGFPRSLYAGFDVLVEPDFRTTRILEVNAFGDLLPRILHEGRDTYEWEILEAIEQHRRAQVSATGA